MGEEESLTAEVFCTTRGNKLQHYDVMVAHEDSSFFLRFSSYHVEHAKLPSLLQRSVEVVQRGAKLLCRGLDPFHLFLLCLEFGERTCTSWSAFRASVRERGVAW